MNNLNEFEFNTEALNESSAYGHQGESAGELGEVSNELEFENYVGKIWEKARRLYNSPQVGHLKNVYIAAAKDYGRKALPAIAGRLGLTGSPGAYAGQTAHAGGRHSLHPHARRQILFYRKVIRHAAHYLLNALKTGYRGPSRPIVTQAFNKASKVVSQSTPLSAGTTGNTDRRKLLYIPVSNVLDHFFVTPKTEEYDQIDYHCRVALIPVFLLIHHGIRTSTSRYMGSARRLQRCKPDRHR